MGEQVVVDMGEVKEKPPLEKGVYTLSFKDNRAFLVRSKKEGSDWIGLQGTLVPEGKPDDAFTVWMAVNHSMKDGIDAKKFLKGLGYAVDGSGAAKLGGELAKPEVGADGRPRINPQTAPQAILLVEGKQPFPVGFLKFKGDVILETNRDNGRVSPRLNAVIGRID